MKVRLLKMLFEIEDALLETGTLQSDFAYIVACPREARHSCICGLIRGRPPFAVISMVQSR